MYQIYIKNINVTLVSFFFYNYSKIWSIYPSLFLCFCLTWTWSWQLELHTCKEVFLKVQQPIRKLHWQWLKNITKPFSHLIQLHKFCNVLQALLKKKVAVGSCQLLWNLCQWMQNLFRRFYSIFILKDGNHILTFLKLMTLINLFVPNGSFLNPMKTLVNLTVFGCFQRRGKECIATK